MSVTLDELQPKLRSSSVLRSAAARCFPDWPVDDRMGLQTRRLVVLPASVATNRQGGEDGQNSDTPQEGPDEVGGDRTALGKGSHGVGGSSDGLDLGERLQPARHALG